MDEILTKAATTAATTLVTGLLGRVFVNAKSEGKPSANQTISVWVVAGLIGAGALVGITIWSDEHKGGDSAKADLPILQSVMAKPNLVTKGGRVTVTVQLDRAAPKGGVSVALTSSDPAVLTVDGNAVVPEGSVMGTGYSQAVDVPTYLSPVQVFAAYNNEMKQTGVNIIKSGADPGVRRTHVVLPSTSPGTSNPVTAAAPPKPVPLDPELAGRLEDAQGRLAAEKDHWDRIQRSMPPGTSLRPEIRSQMFAAESASQRCSKDLQASDASSLKSCVDTLTDHLNQLTLLHN